MKNDVLFSQKRFTNVHIYYYIVYDWLLYLLLLQKPLQGLKKFYLTTKFGETILPVTL